MRVFTFLFSLLLAFLHIALTLIMAAGFLIVFVPGILVRHSLKLER